VGQPRSSEVSLPIRWRKKNVALRHFSGSLVGAPTTCRSGVFSGEQGLTGLAADTRLANCSIGEQMPRKMCGMGEDPEVKAVTVASRLVGR